MRSGDDLGVEDERAIAGGAQLDSAHAEPQLDLVAEIGERADVQAVDKDLQVLPRLDFKARKPVSTTGAGGGVGDDLRWRRRDVSRSMTSRRSESVVPESKYRYGGST